MLNQVPLTNLSYEFIPRSTITKTFEWGCNNWTVKTNLKETTAYICLHVRYQKWGCEMV